MSDREFWPWRDHPVLTGSLPQVFLLLLALSLPVSIAASQICLTVLFFLMVMTFRPHRLTDAGTITVPIILYSGFSVISAIFSVKLDYSLEDLKSLVLFSIPFIVAYYRESIPPLKWLMTCLYVAGGASATWALVQYYNPDCERATGFMSHWMTFAEQMMLIGGVAVAMVLFARGRFRWLSAFAVPLLSAGLVVSLTRSSWIAFAVGVVVLTGIRKPVLLAFVPVVAGIALWLAPEPLQERASSIATVSDTSSTHRIQYLKSGLAIIRDHPLLGVGPDAIKTDEVVKKYKIPQPPVHLHNNIVHLAAERGLPAMFSYLYLMIAAGVLSYQLIRSSAGGVRAQAAAALFAVVGLFTSGLFEANFEDSEVKMLFLFLLSLMFVARDGYGTEKG